jgi:alpha-D-xyloside xylohydrolase
MKAISGVDRLADEVRLRVGEGVLTLRPVAANAVRVQFTREAVAARPSRALVGTGGAAFQMEEEPKGVTVRAARVGVRVDGATGAMTFLGATGDVLLEERAGKRLWASGVGGRLGCGITFLSAADEGIFGTGQFQDGYLNIRDLLRRLTQVNSQIALPALLSSKGWGLLWLQEGMTELIPAGNGCALRPVGQGVTAEVEVTTAKGTQVEKRTEQRFEGSCGSRMRGPRC